MPATRLAGAIAAPVADRERVVADLLPTTARSWFASPVDPRHEAPLLMLAEGVRYARLEVRSEKRRHRNRQERRGSSGGSGTQGLEDGPGALSLRSPALLRGVGDREMDVQPGPTLPHGH